MKLHVSFDAFGRRRDTDWTSVSTPVFGPLASLGFTAQEEDHEIGVIDMHARLYDPRIGRFLNVDPRVANPLNAQSWNGYSYVRNRPTVLIDPTGMEDIPISGPIAVMPHLDALYDKIIEMAINGAGAVTSFLTGAGSTSQEGGSLPVSDAEAPPAPELTESSFVDDGHHTALDAEWRGVWAPTMVFSFSVTPVLVAGGAFVAATPLGDLLGAFAAGYGIGEGIVEEDIGKIALNAGALVTGVVAAGVAGEAIEEAGLMSRGFCFVAGTPIITPDGLQPIETIRVGDRVRTIGDEACAGPTLPHDLQRVEIEMSNSETEGDLFRIVTLRSREWILGNGVEEGKLMHFSLDEIGYRGYGRVVAVSDEVVINDGAGCVVRSTFAHLDGYGPDLGGSLVQSLQRSGILVTRDEALLIQVVAP